MRLAPPITRDQQGNDVWTTSTITSLWAARTGGETYRRRTRKALTSQLIRRVLELAKRLRVQLLTYAGTLRRSDGLEEGRATTANWCGFSSSRTAKKWGRALDVQCSADSYFADEGTAQKVVSMKTANEEEEIIFFVAVEGERETNINHLAAFVAWHVSLWLRNATPAAPKVAARFLKDGRKAGLTMSSYGGRSRNQEKVLWGDSTNLFTLFQ